MQCPLLAVGVVDAILELHDAAGAVCRDQLRTAAGNVAGFSGGDPLCVFVVVNRIGPAQPAAGCGLGHFDKLNLG